jgi:hypothetical protein
MSTAEASSYAKGCHSLSFKPWSMVTQGDPKGTKGLDSVGLTCKSLGGQSTYPLFLAES